MPVDSLKIVHPESQGLSLSRLQRMEDAFQQRVDSGQIAGAVTLLARRGQVVHQGCYGFLDIASARIMQPDTLFRIYSNTKAITSLAVLMLLEQGCFRLDTPIAEFIPVLGDLQVLVDDSDPDSALVPLERPITIFDLLTHTSGLGYGLDPLTPLDKKFIQARMLRMDETLEEKMLRLAQFPLHHQPGVRYTYSMATDVLSRLVEIISGLPLDAFFQQRIFAPLGMSDTGFYVPAEKYDRLATFYGYAPDIGLVDMALLDESMVPFFMTGAWLDKRQKPRFLSGGGGLVSSAPDYLRFALMLRSRGTLDGGQLARPETVDLMTSPYLRPEQFLVPGCGCGFGLVVLTDPALAGIPVSIGAYAGSGAAGTEFWYDPGSDLLGIFMVQYASTTPLTLAQEFRILALQALLEA